MNKHKTCESCGMVMRNETDFGAGHPENKYCNYCTDETGVLKPYQEVQNNMQNFAVKNMGISEKEAHLMAKEGMAKLPAWQAVTNG